MSSLRSMSETADGQMKALQVGHEDRSPAGRPVTEAARSLLAAHGDGGHLVLRQAQKDLAQARREQFFNACRSMVFAAAERWNRAGEPADPHAHRGRAYRRWRERHHLDRRATASAPAPADAAPAMSLLRSQRRERAEKFLGGNPNIDVRGGQEMRPRW